MKDEGFANWTTMLSSVMADKLLDVHTMLPGVIDSFDPSTQRAKVLIGPAAESSTGEKMPYPAVINVPVSFPRFGGYSLTMPVVRGDPVAVFFSERSMADWKDKGVVGAVPQVARFFALADAFAVPGCAPNGKTIPSFNASATELKSDDGSVKIRLTSGGNVSIIAGALTCDILPSGKVNFTNAYGELNSITQDMLSILTAAVPAPSLSAYNTLKANRNTFV